MRPASRRRRASPMALPIPTARSRAAAARRAAPVVEPSAKAGRMVWSVMWPSTEAEPTLTPECSMAPKTAMPKTQGSVRMECPMTRMPLANTPLRVRSAVGVPSSPGGAASSSGAVRVLVVPWAMRPPFLRAARWPVRAPTAALRALAGCGRTRSGRSAVPSMSVGADKVPPDCFSTGHDGPIPYVRAVGADGDARTTGSGARITGPGRRVPRSGSEGLVPHQPRFAPSRRSLTGKP